MGKRSVIKLTVQPQHTKLSSGILMVSV